ncbi:MAG TPA: cupin-like domain-containing protein [Rhizomicrobium sp.]|jgi:ribosomal protein L16 Arg81 hydroxylase
MIIELSNIPELHNVDLLTFRNEILPQAKPVVLKGLIADWPATRAARSSPQAIAEYLKVFDSGRVSNTLVAEAEVRGKFFYGSDLRSFNFAKRQERISDAIDRLLTDAPDENAPATYVQSMPIPEYMPGFANANVNPLVHASVPGRIWIGNRLTVTTHYDLSDNLACVVAGRRRFTLFPPDQIANLYPGPLEFTPAGTPVSMVDLGNPDFDRFPNFRTALAAAQTAELEPGDALFIPYFWWHHVQSLEPFNVLVNYWWNEGRPPLPGTYDCLLHALLAIREMPDNQRAAWRAAFDYYIFKTHGEPLAHLPPEVRGGMGPMTPQRAHDLKQMLLRGLMKQVARP